MGSVPRVRQGPCKGMVPCMGGALDFAVRTALGLFLITLSHALAGNPPEIERPPQPITVKNGGIAVFYCYAAGNPAPHFIWKKNGKKLGYTDSRYLISDFEGGSLLRIEPVRKKEEAGAYECVAENGNGNPVSATADLTVFEEKALPAGFPQIIQNPVMKVVEQGRHAVLVCEASGSPKPTNTWIKDKMPIDLKANPRLSLMKYGRLRGSLRIEATEETDQGKYECVATNSVGTEYSSSARLFVRVRRVPPHFTIRPEFKYEVKKGGSLNIACAADGDPMPFVRWRQGEATTDWVKLWRNLEKSRDLSGSSRGVKDLTPDDALPIGKNVLLLTNIRKTNTYTCAAASRLGIIETKTSVKVQSPPQAPTNVTVQDVQPTSVILSWSYDGDVVSSGVPYYVIQYKPKAATSDYKEIKGHYMTCYEVYYMRKQENFAKANCMTTEADFRYMTYNIQGLSPYTEYEFGVLAVNGVGRGKKSIVALATTGGETRRVRHLCEEILHKCAQQEPYWRRHL